MLANVNKNIQLGNIALHIYMHRYISVYKYFVNMMT